jgi:DNA-binding response OmpR family regulator
MYITKPFDADELVLRLGNILSRAKQVSGAGSDTAFHSIGSYQFYPEELRLVRNGITKILTEKEAKLLLYLYKHNGVLIRREQILKELWDETDFFSGRSMDVFITRLRKYLAGDPGISIDSVRGVGYQFSIIV